MFPVTKPQLCVSAASLASNVDAETVNTTRFLVQNPDGDHKRPLAVCRVCLAMSVKMYNMLEHKLSIIYERIIGVEINSEDKLPPMLCWECRARLSSANNFIIKALKTHWILINKICGDKITMSDIASIDRAQYQLESTLGFKYNEVNNTDLHIQRENEITSEVLDPSNVKLWINKYDDELNDQQEEADLQVPRPIIITKENLSDDEMTVDSVSNVSDLSEEDYQIMDKEREVNEAIKQKQKGKKISVTALSSSRNEGLLLTKELRIILEDVMLSFKNQSSLRGPLTKSIKKGNLLEDENNSKKILKTVNSNIHFIHHDVEFPKNIFICDICDNSYQKKATLIRHIRGHSNLYKCTDWGYKTNDKSSLKIHVNRKHTKNTVYNYHCTYCTYKACIKGNFDRHVNSKHTKNNIYNCSHCSFKTYLKSSLNRHVNARHTKNTVYNCSYCSFKTYDTSNLHQHVNAKHTKNTVYNCIYCTYKACAKGNLDSHVNSIHSKKKVYTCSRCSFKTYAKKNLNRHVNASHTKNTVYNCTYCTYKTYTKGTLDRHVNSKHTKNNVYNCSHCSFKTYLKSSLNRHVNASHTKNTVYNCSYCSFKTYNKSNLPQHVNAKHTKNTVYNCTYCTFKTYIKKSLNTHVKCKHTKRTVHNV